MLRLQDVTKTYRDGPGLVTALDSVDLAIDDGAFVAVMGPSGSGKTTLALIAAAVETPTAGDVHLDDIDLAHAGSGARAKLRRRDIGIVFQRDELDPLLSAEENVALPLRLDGQSERTARLAAGAALARCGVDAFAARLPAQLSGGQRQRVAIARTLAVEPVVLLADEPTSMLDVSIRIGILNLMLKLKEERRIAFLYVTHDLASARYVADDILVMYAGQIVEQGPVEEVLADPLHPYTQLLLSAVPDPGTGVEAKRIEVRKGLASAAVDPPEGCRFVARCPIAIDVCSSVTPPLVEARPDQSARCHVNAPEPAAVFAMTERTP